MITITIKVQRDLKFAKEMYNRHFNNPINQKVLKSDLADFFAMLLEGDLDAIAPDDLEIGDLEISDEE